VAGVLILFFFPDQTGERFAWQITPHMTSLYIGAGYLGGSWLFVNMLSQKRWHRVHSGFLPITTFTWFMLFATLLHWERFSHGKLGFTLWLPVRRYAVPRSLCVDEEPQGGYRSTRRIGCGRPLCHGVDHAHHRDHCAWYGHRRLFLP
jgi:hypothetical protein